MTRRIVLFLLTALLMAGVPVTAAEASSAAVQDRCYYEIPRGTSVHDQPNGPVVFVVGQNTFALSFDESDPNWVGVSIPSNASGDLPVPGYVRRATVRLVRCL